MLLTTILPLLAATLLPQPATRPADAPLSGPKVAADATAPTIARSDLDGRVRRPESSPEEAAARLLELDSESRAAVDAVFTRRAAILDRFIENNLDLITRLITAESAPGKEKLALVLETLDKSQELRAEGPLDQQVRDALPDHHRKQFNRLLADYWRAIAAEDQAQPKPKGRVGAVIDEKFKSLGRELEAAYKRCERSGALLYHYLFDSIDVTPAQEAQLRKLCASYAMGGLDNKDKKAQGLMFANLTQLLTPEQGRQLAAKFKGGQPAYVKRKPATSTPPEPMTPSK